MRICIICVCIVYICVCCMCIICVYIAYVLYVYVCVYMCVCLCVCVCVCVYIYACFALVRVLVCSVLGTPDFIVSRHSCLLSREATRTFTLGYNNLVPFDLW